jgi:hypothetical protein
MGQQVLCIQPHPEFDPEYSAFLLEKRRAQYGEVVYQEALFGAGRAQPVPTLDSVFEGLADYVQAHFEPDVLDALIR